MVTCTCIMLPKHTEVGGNQLMCPFVQVLVESIFFLLTGWLTHSVFWLVCSNPYTSNIVFETFIKYIKQDRTRRSLSQPILLSLCVLLCAAG